MVTERLMEELKNVIKKYGINSKEAYQKSMQIAYEIENKFTKVTVSGYYNTSIYALTEYIKNNEKNPNEKSWNKMAVEDDYLSSETIGYLYGEGFNKLCKDIRKKLKK